MPVTMSFLAILRLHLQAKSHQKISFTSLHFSLSQPQRGASGDAAATAAALRCLFRPFLVPLNQPSDVRRRWRGKSGVEPNVFFAGGGDGSEGRQKLQLLQEAHRGRFLGPQHAGDTARHGTDGKCRKTNTQQKYSVTTKQRSAPNSNIDFFFVFISILLRH